MARYALRLRTCSTTFRQATSRPVLTHGPRLLPALRPRPSSRKSQVRLKRKRRWAGVGSKPAPAQRRVEPELDRPPICRRSTHCSIGGPMSATGGAQAAAAAAEGAPVEATSTRRGSGLGREPTALSDFVARFDHKVIPYVLIAPFFVLFAVFGLYPLIYNGVV